MAAVLNPWSCSSSSTPQLQLLLLFHFLVVVPATSLNFSYDHTFTTNDFRQEDDAMVIAGQIELLGVEFTERGRGRALYKQPMQLWDEATGEEASFAASFNFTITSAAGKNSSQAGHGMAFFLAPFMPDFPQDCYDGCLGLLNKSLTATSGAGAMGNASGAARFVAVEFDTHKDAWDPSPRHVGVDVDNVDSLSREDYVVVLPDDSLVDAGVLSATVAYDGGARRLNVTLAGDGATYRRLSAAIHLRSLLPEQVAVGFSAATSDEFTSNHTVLSCKFSSTLPTRTPSATSPPSSKPAHLIAATAAAGAAVLLLLAVSIFVLIRRRNGSGNGSDGDESSLIDSSGDGEFESGSTGPRRIPYAHLAAATRDFAEDGKLGQGGSGSVYGGHVTEMGRDVAIKVFTRGASMEGRKEYRSEVTVISRLRHRNLVQLIGWCHGRRRLLLVYELVRNGSLDGYLYDGKEETLTWPIRYHIILGLASAVQYLHQEWDQCVVHGDIKPSNIMLDESFNAKLGDFGLARLIDHGMSLQTMTAVAGTPGYLDPECVITGRASAESDMYSFGVVLLEVVCGRRPMIVAPRASADDDDGDGEGQGQVFRLVEWAWELYGRGATEALADARLGGEFDRWEMARVVGVGLWCAHPDPKARPGIRQAAEALQSRKFRMPVLPPRMPVAVYLQPFETSTMKYYSDLSMSSVVSDSEAVGYSSASRTTVTQSSGCSLPPGPLGHSSSPRE